MNPYARETTKYLFLRNEEAVTFLGTAMGPLKNLSSTDMRRIYSVASRSRWNCRTRLESVKFRSVMVIDVGLKDSTLADPMSLQRSKS